MDEKISFTRKSIIVAAIIALIAFFVFGGVCVYVGYNHGVNDTKEYYANLENNAETDSENMTETESETETEISEASDDDVCCIMTYHVATEKDPLNIREYPEQSSESIGKIPRGINIEIVKVEGNWGLTKYQETAGWVNLEYCEAGPANPEDFSSYEEEDMVWIVDTDEAYAYHKSTCRYVQREDVLVVPRTQAEDMGRVPCERCGG